MTDLDAKNQEMAMKGTIRRQPFAGATGDQPSESPLAQRHDGPDKASLHMGWQRISHKLKGDLGEAKWKAWIKPLTCEAIDDSLLILRADTSFLRDRVLSNYAEKLRLLAKSEFDGVQAVDVVLHGAERASPLASQSAPAGDYPPRMTSAMGETEATPHLAGRAGQPVDLRQFHCWQAEPTCLCNCQACCRKCRSDLQPAVFIWWRWFG